MAGMAAENAKRGRVEREMHPFADQRADPSHGQGTGELAMCEKRDVSRQRGETRDEPVGAGGNLIWRLAPWATVAKDTPAGMFFTNVRGLPSFVIAVIPLHQAGFHFRRGAKAGQFAGPPRALQGAGQDVRE